MNNFFQKKKRSTHVLANLGIKLTFSYLFSSKVELLVKPNLSIYLFAINSFPEYLCGLSLINQLDSRHYL